ncbi:polysaccharide biosynthesis tyrosine autokinase [bacterium]|nr:MAG: polysaccharide biosynthesis tyrosine autokinase [bacterium]
MDKSSLVPLGSNGASSDSGNGVSAQGVQSNGATEALAAFSENALAADWRVNDQFSGNAGPAKYTNEEPTNGFDFQQLLAVMRRRWPIMLAAFLLSTGVGITINLLAKPVYQASATVEVDTGPASSIGPDIAGLEGFVQSKQSRSIDTQVEILRGGPIRAEAKKRLTQDQAKFLQGFAPVTVEQRNDSNLLDVVTRSYNPEVAAAFANAICDQYIDFSRQKNQNNSLGAIEYVKGQIETVKKQLAGKQNELKEFKQKTGIFMISETGTALAGNLAQAQSALQQVEAERAASEAQLKNMRAQLATIPSSKVVPDGITRNPAFDALQTQLTQLEIQRSAALQEYVPESFKVRSLDADIKATRGKMQRMAQNIVSGYKPDPVREPLLQSIATMQSQVWATDARVTALNGQLSEAKKALSQLPEQEFQFSQLTTDVTVLQQSYQQLVAKQKSLEIGVGGQVADARMVFEASPSSSPVAPDKKRTLLYSVMLGLLGAVALAMLVDALDNRIYNDADATRATSLPVLAHIPYIKNTLEQSLVNTGDRVTPLLESFRMLRANIAFSAADKPIRAIVVTSSVPNEGKSNSALNLAIATALGGERTVLIDLDLRRPTQHKLSNLPNAIGFTNVISGQATLEEALQETDTPGLRVLTSGPVPPNPFRLLNSQSARQTILKVIETADFVVVDTPPMLGLADARLISSLVDGTLMIISCQETGRREAGRASDLLLQTGNEVLGTVLTKVPASNDAYGYYSYQHYDRYFSEEDTSGNGLSTHEDAPALEEGNGKKRRSKSK